MMKLHILPGSALFLASLFAVSPAHAQAGVRPAHETYIPTASAGQQAAIQVEVERLIMQFGDGLAETYSENPTIVRYGQLFEDHHNDAVALFNLEGFGGGNFHAEFIAFFSEVEQGEVAGKTAKPYRLVAVSKLGERGWRTFDFSTVSIQNRAVKLRGMEMRSSDAMCCPSIPITKIFHVDEFDHIVESKSMRSKRGTHRQ